MPATKEIWRRSQKNLVEFFGADKPLAAITQGDTIEFWNYLISPDGANLKESTARKRYVHANMFFLHAMRKKLIADNPFADNGVVKTNLAGEKYHFLDGGDAHKIVDQLPTTQWKLLFALARWGGLRVGSEPRAITWDDIDWENQRFTVHAKKTKRTPRPRNASRADVPRVATAI